MLAPANRAPEGTWLAIAAISTSVFSIKAAFGFGTVGGDGDGVRVSGQPESSKLVVRHKPVVNFDGFTLSPLADLIEVAAARLLYAPYEMVGLKRPRAHRSVGGGGVGLHSQTNVHSLRHAWAGV